MQKLNAFLMFNGKAEEAINHYISIFESSDIINMVHYEDGSVLHCTFTLKGQKLMAIDNINKNDIPFTPAISLFVTCDTEAEIDTVFGKLAQDGQVLVPLGPTPVSEKFGWVADKYGVSWQLNLAKN